MIIYKSLKTIATLNKAVGELIEVF